MEKKNALMKALDHHARFVEVLLDVPESSSAMLREICQRIPLVLKQVWRYRDTVIRPQFGDGSGDMPCVVADLLLDYLRIHRLLQ